MSEVPTNLKYTKTHEWVRLEENGNALVGITDHAQHLLGDMVYVELPEMNASVHAGDECGVLESVKAASDIYSPISGEIVEVNEALLDSPALVNSDPYAAGWLIRIRPIHGNELDKLLDTDDYNKLVAAEES